MTENQRIELGRKCAYGIDQLVDIEGAYRMWNGIEYMLDEEDRDAFYAIREIVLENSGISCPRSYAFACKGDLYQSGSYSDYTIQIANKSCSEEELRALCEELIASAVNNKKTGSLYSKLNAIKREIDSEKATRTERPRKIENVRFGNNLRYIIYYYWTSLDNFQRKMNIKLKNMGLDTKESKQGFYQIISGKNGMDQSGKIVTVDMVNEMRKLKGGLTRDLTIQDFELSLTAFVALFSPAKIDEKAREILTQEAMGLL